MRVGIDAHTVGRRQTGNERFTVELTNALVARGDIEVLAYVDDGVGWPIGATKPPTLGELHARRPQLRIPFELPIRGRRDGLDVLQVAYLAPPVLRTPLVTVVHDLSFEDMPEMYPWSTRWRLKLGVRRAVAQSAAVVTGSHFTRERLIDLYGLPASRVHRVVYGVSPSWRPLDDAQSAPGVAALGLPERFVLAVGTGAPRKNLPRLVEAVRAVRVAGAPDLGLVLAGPVDSIGGAETEPWVHTLGYVGDDVLRGLYSAADVVAIVSLYEGFALPVLEAMACAAVVVASSTTAVADAAGEAAVLVDPARVNSIADGIRRALEDTGLRDTLRRRATDHASQFSWEACAAQLVEIYRQVASRRG